MKEQVLGIEQMQELIDMGVDVSKASMCYLIIRDHLVGEESTYLVESDSFLTTYLNESNNISIKDKKYTFTLQDILDMLPKNIDKYIPLEMQPYGKPYNVINFGYWRGERLGWLKFCKDMHSTINSAFELLKWCKENNFI